MLISESRLRRMIVQELSAMRVQEAVAPVGAAKSPAPVTPPTQLGGRVMIGNQTALQKYGVFSASFKNSDGSLKTQQEMYKAIGLDIDKLGSTDKGGIFLIEAGGYFIGLAGYPKPTTEQINAATRAARPLSGDISQVLEGEEEGLAAKFDAAYSTGAQDRRMTQAAPGAKATAPAPGTKAAQGVRTAPNPAVQQLQGLVGAGVDGYWGEATNGAINSFLIGLRIPIYDAAGALVRPQDISTNWRAFAPKIASIGVAKKPATYQPNIQGMINLVNNLKALANEQVARAGVAPQTPAAPMAERRTRAPRRSR